MESGKGDTAMTSGKSSAAVLGLVGGVVLGAWIGSVLTMHPRVLVLDEPTSALDPTAAEDVLAILSRLVHDVGMSVVLAEHRLERVVPFLLQDRLVERGARFEAAPKWQKKIVADGRLVTGQNPASAAGVADGMVALLQ